MSRYRWLRPLKCLETMECFPSLKDKSFAELRELLFAAVRRGDVRVNFNDVVVPSAHIAAWVDNYADRWPDQEPHTLPPDFGLNYDDLCAVFDRPNIDNRKRGRPRKENSGWSEDQRLAFEMHRMLAGAPGGLPPAQTAAEAARILVDAGRVPGAGTPESRAKRLTKVFRKYYSSG